VTYEAPGNIEAMGRSCAVSTTLILLAQALAVATVGRPRFSDGDKSDGEQHNSRPDIMSIVGGVKGGNPFNSHQHFERYTFQIFNGDIIARTSWSGRYSVGDTRSMLDKTRVENTSKVENRSSSTEYIDGPEHEDTSNTARVTAGACMVGVALLIAAVAYWKCIIVDGAEDDTDAQEEKPDNESIASKIKNLSKRPPGPPVPLYPASIMGEDQNDTEKEQSALEAAAQAPVTTDKLDSELQRHATSPTSVVVHSDEVFTV
jgi:hypothetical protein